VLVYAGKLTELTYRYHISPFLTGGLPDLLKDLPCCPLTPASDIHHIFGINHYASRYYFMRIRHNWNGNFAGTATGFSLVVVFKFTASCADVSL